MDFQDHLVNSTLIKMARNMLGGISKQAFIPGGDMSGGGDPSGGGGAPPGGDPSGGGAPPGGDPSGGGGDPMAAIQPMIQQAVQQALMQQGGGGGGMNGGMGASGKNALTPKIDEKAVMLQMLKILARIADQLGVKIPASEMVVNQQDMMGLAQASSAGSPLPGMDPTASGGGGGGAGAIPPVDPMQGMQPAGQPGMDATKQGSYINNGVAFDSSGLAEIGNKAAAIARMRKLARTYDN